MKTLQEIKDTYAKEHGYEDWDDLWHAHIHKLLDFEIVMNDICLIAQKEALEKAADNFTSEILKSERNRIWEGILEHPNIEQNERGHFDNDDEIYEVIFKKKE